MRKSPSKSHLSEPRLPDHEAPPAGAPPGEGTPLLVFGAAGGSSGNHGSSSGSGSGDASGSGGGGASSSVTTGAITSSSSNLKGLSASRASLGAAGAPEGGLLRDMAGSGLVRCLLLDRRALVEARDTLQAV
jgi:hypothetical protein